MAFGNRPLTTRLFNGKINSNLQACPIENHFKECNVSLVTGLYLFIHIPCYQMCVDQLININNFYLCGVDINYLNGRSVEILCCFFFCHWGE